ncbi:helix-turn-helix domain-containing protein [Bradyrhizobium algeriense]|uniref:AlbA family DNA-binding domain-containing protein n=1 Tax=Bradyrhizobium algeriense TaxID=634784 RepID=UPI000D3DA7A1|nr:ATP-binding protein [Bradyrhizobium algeriense]
MPESDLSELVAGRSEDLGVEYKAWMDTSQAEVRAKLARHIAALANHGGGYLIFGVDDKTRQPQGATELDAELFNQDAISAIVKRYLEPRIQIRVDHAEHGGVPYPVVIVPSHGARPVIAAADGPQDDKGRPIGIRQGEIYIRAAGPESVQIKHADDWNTLLERCLSHRSDLLGKILRQSIAKPSQPSTQSRDMLRDAVDAIAQDFTTQTEALAALAPAEETRIRAAGRQFATLGYILLDAGGEPIEIENVRNVNERVSVAMHQYAYTGWASFLPLTVPERAPQTRIGTLLGKEYSYLEGMRLENTGLLTGAFDYWRIYGCGLAVTIESYHEDYVTVRHGVLPHLTPLQIFVKLHSLLAHARLLGQEIPGVHQIVVRMDWRGLAGRTLMWDETNFVSPVKLTDDRFAKTMTLSWPDLRDDYFMAFRRVALPVFDLFANAGWFEPITWLTPELVEREFAKLQVAGMRLFDT